MHLCHKLAVTLCEVVVYGYDMHSLACKRIKIRGESGNESFTFTRFHFCDTALMQYDAADDLYRVVADADNSCRSLTAYRKSIWQYLIQSLAVCEALLQYACLRLKLLVAHSAVFIGKVEHGLLYGLDALQLFGRVGSEYRFK